MRTLAVSLLLFAAVVFALTRDQDGFLGFVNAGAEASMVGAIADWFAVTALFKHPLGLPVPPAFVIPIEECRRFHAGDGRLDDAVWEAVRKGIAGLERDTGRRLGDPEAPLLVSVRSGAAVSMPGMMDTILNLGITDAVAASAGTLGNVGPGLGFAGPMGSYQPFSDFSKLVMALLMWVGRLEVLPVLVLLTRGYWRV